MNGPVVKSSAGHARAFDYKTVCPLLRLRWLAPRYAKECCSVVRAELQRGERAMQQSAEIFVGIDASRACNAIAGAGGAHKSEVRYLCEVDSSVDSMRRLLKRITGKHAEVLFFMS
jgi:hypothetical protein